MSDIAQAHLGKTLTMSALVFSGGKSISDPLLKAILMLFELYEYCKTRKFHLRLIFAISADEANQ